MRVHLSVFVMIAAVSVISFAQQETAAIRLDPALDAIISPNSKIEKVAGGFGFTEGPVWIRKGGYLVFSDIPANVIHKWNPDTGQVSTVLDQSGFTGTDLAGVGMMVQVNDRPVYLIGSNGITVDRQGRLVFCAHGDREIVRMENDGRRTVLAERYQGKRLNSPNDLAFKSDGSLYFTDPTHGLRGGDQDPKRELPFTGVYLLREGKLQLLIRDMLRPNGLAFSPDEKFLYVNDTIKKTILKFDVLPDDTVTNSRLFVDMSSDQALGAPDGMKVDQKGNVYSVGPGGVWIMSPDGKHLGTLLVPERPGNIAFGGSDGKTLFIAARTSLYRIRVGSAGILP